MDKAQVIPDTVGIELFKRTNPLTEDEAAMLEVWLFHKRPPSDLVIFTDKDYQFGFSEFGDRLGIADYFNCPHENGIYFEGDNNISYEGSLVPGYATSFSVKVMEHEIERVYKKCENFLILISKATINK